MCPYEAFLLCVVDEMFIEVPLFYPYSALILLLFVPLNLPCPEKFLIVHM